MTAVASIAPNAALAPSSLEERAEFLVRLAVALHSFGAPSHRVEPLLVQLAEQIGVQGDFFVEPTAIHMALQTESGPVSRFSRVQLGQDDLEKLARLDHLALTVATGERTLTAARAELDRILEAPPRHGPSVEAAGFALASGTAAIFFGGGAIECAAAALAGAGVAALSRWSSRHPRTAPIFEGFAAFLLGISLAALAAVVPLAAEVAILAGLIILLPGLRLTVAVSELATGHLASGVARLASTAVSFGALGFGALLAGRVAVALFGAPGDVIPTIPLPSATTWLALALAPVGFAVLLRAAPRDILPIVATAPLGFLAARVGGDYLGPDLGPFVGAFAITALSNLLAQRRNRPTSVTLVPGILLLVPGSLGFRSLATLMSHDVVVGVETAVQMITVAMALVGGMLFANVLVPARRAL